MERLLSLDLVIDEDRRVGARSQWC
jgi:hypothetical protein